MLPSTRFTHALLLTTLLLASVHAAPITAELDVQAMESPGPFTTQGFLVGLIQDTTINGSLVPTGSFELKTDHLRVEVDDAETTINVVDGAYRHRLNPETNSEEFQDATVLGSEARAGFEFFVVPVASDGARIQVDAACGGLSPSDVDAQEIPPQVRDDARERTVIESGDALHWSECGRDATATVTGDFLVGLWEHSATLTADNESMALESGRSKSDNSPHAATDDTITHDRQVFLYVTGGRLTLPLEVGVHRDLYVQDARIDAALLQLRAATGNLEAAGQAVEMDGDDVLLQGRLTLDATGAGAGAAFPLHVAGDLDAMHVNGRPLTVATTTASPELPWWGLVTGAGLVVGVLVAAWWVRPLYHERLNRAYGGDAGSVVPESLAHRRGVGYWLLSKRANQRDHHRRGLWYARRAAALFPWMPQSQAMIAIQESHLDRNDEAIRDCIDVYPKLRPGRERAQLACTAAATSIQADELEAAVDWLELGLRDDPGFVLARLSNPIYRVLEGVAGFDVLKTGTEADTRSLTEDPAIF